MNSGGKGGISVSVACVLVRSEHQRVFLPWDGAKERIMNLFSVRDNT